MKQLFFLWAFLLFAGLPATAQRPASLSLQNRKAVLELFTGIHCRTCPAAHKVADSLKAVKPAGSMFIVNIHSGIGALPGAGEPELRTSDGSAIAGITGMNIPYFPSGAVNRHRFGSNTGFAINSAQWSGYIDSVQAQSSSHNIALDAALNVDTRKLSVYIDVRGMNNFPAIADCNLTVMLLEDSVSGPQLGGALYYPANIEPADSSYKHNYVLRKILSSPYYPTGSYSYPPGAYSTQSLFYTVPASYVNNPSILGNLRILAFLLEGGSNIITAATGPIGLTGFPGNTDLQIMPDVQVEKEVCTAALKPVILLYNNGSSSASGAVLRAQVNGLSPVNINFNRSIGPAKSALFALPPLSLVPDSANSLRVKIVTVNGIADPIPAGDSVLVQDILRTKRLAKGKYVVMKFIQDRFGMESRWQILEEATGIVKLTGGPYPNLSSNGILQHIDSFEATPKTCYDILVFDVEANGINTGSGAGRFEVTSNGQILYANTGAFGARSRSVFKTAVQLTTLPSDIAGIPDFSTSVSLSPNPAAGETGLFFSLAKDTKLFGQVIDMTGRIVAQIANQNLPAGSHVIPVSTVNLAGGLYHIRLVTAAGVVTRRLVVVK